jgi:hypothetical protein
VVVPTNASICNGRDLKTGGCSYQDLEQMKLLLALIGWLILLALCWPLALLVLLIFPLVWLVALPFRLGLAVLEGAIPSRLLGLGRKP